jgi:gliding motility-associated-like protein
MLKILNYLLINIALIRTPKSLYKFALILFFIFSLPSYSQLTDFELSVQKTDETCLGNGSIAFTVENATPLATFLFTVYKVPNLSTPISVSSLMNLSSLNAGTYKIIGTQLLGSLTNSKEREVTIENHIVPLTYDIASINNNCSRGGQVKITPTSGTIAAYEIISGPVVRPLQNSNVFNDLPAGTYNIRVFDECGEGVVRTYTLVMDEVELAISDATYSDTTTGACDSITATSTVSANESGSISYPLTIKYTIHPPDGAADYVITKRINSGELQMVEVSQILPLYGDDRYLYDIKVTDACGNVFVKNENLVNPKPKVRLTFKLGNCGGKYLKVSMSNYKAPLQINLTSTADFDPILFNPMHPGPFDGDETTYGSETNPVPAGDYVIVITDACGRTSTDRLTIEDVLPEPTVTATNNGCFALVGKIKVSVPGANIVAAIITDAPDGYTVNTPQDVSDNIREGKLILENMPIGTYKIKITDDCGIVYNIIAEVPPFVEQDFEAIPLSDCTIGIGSVLIKSLNGKLSSLQLVSAPGTFNSRRRLPIDVSSEISASGQFFMSNLPIGEYIFSGEDVCGVRRTVTITVTGYIPDSDPFVVDSNCGSFDITMADDDAVSVEPAYWLQKYDASTGNWVHPSTGVVYTEGSMPDIENSFPVSNNIVTHNLTFTGKLRVLKSFKALVNETEQKTCTYDLGDFEYGMLLKINDIYTISCTEQTNGVYIEALNGLQPYTYKITKKDGEDYVVDNGSNNTFSNLEPGIYNFVVEDACHNLAQKTVNVNLLPPLVTAHVPEDMLLCLDSGPLTNLQFNLLEQNSAILGQQSPELYTVSYHLTEADAEAGQNALPSLYTSISNPQTLYARVVNNTILICHDVVSFKINASHNPVIQMEAQQYICNDNTLVLTADDGYDAYTWSTGENTQSITVDEPGNYTLSVKNYYGNKYCENDMSFTVSPSEAATNIEVETEDWTWDQNSITVSASGNGNYQYSLDNVNYQAEPVFNNLLIGNYTVYIKDINGCGVVKKEVLLLSYPNFFTPNGDGTHDKWRIKYSYMEPEMTIQIFDRYGKLMTSIDPQGEGWDGTYNGIAVPSTDYWFVVTRANGQVHKGHFAMKR